MNRELAQIEFGEENRFDLAPEFDGRADLEKRFALLKDSLLDEELAETRTITLHPRLKQAANEAAGLAWTTGFPLLTFPALFAELVHRERLRENQQQRIRARSEMLLEHAV